MAGRWVTIKGQHVFIDEYGLLRPGGPKGAGKAAYVGHHDAPAGRRGRWRRIQEIGVREWPTDRKTSPVGRGMAHRRPGDTERPAKPGLSPGDREREYWRTHPVRPGAPDYGGAPRPTDAQEREAYGRNLHRAFGEWFRDMKKDFEAAQTIITVLDYAPRALATAKKVLAHIGGAGAARGGGAAIKLSSEGLVAKQRLEAAVAKAEAAVERAAKTADRYGAKMAETLKQQRAAAEATREAGSAASALEKHVTAAEAVRRVGSLGPHIGRDQGIEKEAVMAGKTWASAIKEAIKAKVPFKSSKSTLRGPEGKFLSRRPAKP